MVNKQYLQDSFSSSDETRNNTMMMQDLLSGTIVSMVALSVVTKKRARLVQCCTQKNMQDSFSGSVLNKKKKKHARFD